ncbi:TetR/AcrR family transcriptional regulator [Nocardia sp. NPDC050175]|uniref:TetR/AcrR family transcriptional regulator n=1 Tax=Nocardia sp. NPDC050175 TaxID=3364317 RepID=UPI0037A88792
MGRKRNWDRAEVLAAAMGLFRRRGFLGASTRDLEQATGLHPGSLYREFTSKEELFRAALAAYNVEVVQARVQRYLLDSADPLVGIREFFVSAFETGVDPDPGCLLTNSAVESFGLPEAGPEVRQGLDIIEAGFLAALRKAQSLNLLPELPRTDALAAQLLTLYQGLLVLVRAGTPSAKLHMITTSSMASIGVAREAKR